MAGIAATTPEIARTAAALVEVELEPLEVVTDFAAALGDDAPLVHPDWESYDGADVLGRHDNLLGFSTIVKGDVDAALEAADVVVSGRYVTDPTQGVPIEPRAVVAQWEGDRVTVWSSTQVPYVARAGVAYTLGIPESHVRVVVPLLGGGFGAKCDFHFEAHVAALARAARRPVKLVFSRHEEFFAVGHRREGMVIELTTGRAERRHAARAARAARPRRRGVLRRGRLLRADGGDARARPLRARDGGRRVVARLLEQPAVLVDPRPDRAAGLLGARAAHGRARRRARARSRRAAPPDADRGGLCDPDGPGARADLDEGDARARRRADRPRRRAARRRGDRRRVRLVAVLPREGGRVRQAQRGRHGNDRHGRAGERHRRGDGAAPVRRRGARHAARGLLAPLPGHGRRSLGQRLLRLADDVQQRPGRARRRGRGARAAARCGIRQARGGADRPRAGRRRRPREGIAREVGEDRAPGGPRDVPREGRR